MITNKFDSNYIQTINAHKFSSCSLKLASVIYCRFERVWKRSCHSFSTFLVFYALASEEVAENNACASYNYASLTSLSSTEETFCFVKSCYKLNIW